MSEKHVATPRRRPLGKLGEYRRKRHFDVTAEPEGTVATRGDVARLAFVVQKHRATALHYDFRLEWRGVMLSWAVPKGPSLDPAVKRMAMQVEDHPLAYNQFEGVIPAGQYGGGTVMIWDCGTWKPESEDVDRGLETGELKLTLMGQKLRGSWVLVRLRARLDKSAWHGCSSNIETSGQRPRTLPRRSHAQSNRSAFWWKLRATRAAI
jgi:bifunctional non-homologous end joining protein LigD